MPLELEGGALELEPADVEITVESRAAFDVEADGRFVVWLDTALDQELVDEGLAREVVNRVNALRKARGLAPEERIALELHPGDGDVARALERHRELLARETLAVELRVSADAARPRGRDLGPGRGPRARGGAAGQLTPVDGDPRSGAGERLLSAAAWAVRRWSGSSGPGS